MSDATVSAARRRQSLVEVSERNRAALAQAAGALMNRFALADTIVSTARGLGRHRVVIAAASLWLLFATRGSRAWLRRAVGLAPLVLDGLRLARSARDARRESRAD